MKQRLRELYYRKPNAFKVWEYLWIFADEKNSIEFSKTEISTKLNVPLSTVDRIIMYYMTTWNDEAEKVIVEHEKVGYKLFRITFHPKGKKERTVEKVEIHEELFKWLKEDYYPSVEYDYSDLTKHKRYVKLICDKLSKALKSRNRDASADVLRDTFKVFFKQIDSWWVENGNISLTVINKNFTKILNQQIQSNVGTKKRDSYTKAAEESSSIDFSKLAEE